MSGWMGKIEAAKHLAVSLPSLDLLIDQGLPCARAGKRIYRLHKDDMDKWMRSQDAGGGLKLEDILENLI